MRVWAVLLALGLGFSGESAVADDPATACIAKGTALVAALAAGDASRATVDFDATMRAALPPETLAAVWVSTVAKSGAYEGADAAVAARGNEAAPHWP